MSEKQPLFPLGQIVATPGALEAFEAAGEDPVKYFALHQIGEWGDLDEHDRKENEVSVKEGYRILSAYKLSTGVKIWIITEHNRSVSTALLPSEY